MAKTWLITGASRGFGLEIAKAALASGDNVVATARNPKRLEAALADAGGQLFVQPLDVTSSQQAGAAVQAALAKFGQIDVLVNNAGYGQLGPFETNTIDEARAQFETNVFGVFNLTWAVLPVMRKQRSGHIINISSIAGVAGGPGGSIYCASKHAVEGFAEAMAPEVEPFGIKVTLIEPAFFRTEFMSADSIRFGGKAVEDYSGFREQFDAFLATQVGNERGDPARLAAAVIKIVNEPAPPFRLAAGSEAFGVIEAKAERLRTELNDRKALSLSMDYDSESAQ